MCCGSRMFRWRGNDAWYIIGGRNIMATKHMRCQGYRRLLANLQITGRGQDLLNHCDAVSSSASTGWPLWEEDSTYAANSVLGIIKQHIRPIGISNEFSSFPYPSNQAVYSVFSLHSVRRLSRTSNSHHLLPSPIPVHRDSACYVTLCFHVQGYQPVSPN